jgi:hypothetical protein
MYPDRNRFVFHEFWHGYRAMARRTVPASNNEAPQGRQERNYREDQGS